MAAARSRPPRKPISAIGRAISSGRMICNGVGTRAGRQRSPGQIITQLLDKVAGLARVSDGRQLSRLQSAIHKRPDQTRVPGLHPSQILRSTPPAAAQLMSPDDLYFQTARTDMYQSWIGNATGRLSRPAPVGSRGSPSGIRPRDEAHANPARECQMRAVCAEPNYISFNPKLMIGQPAAALL